AIGIAALLFLALKVGSISGSGIQSPYTLSAHFDNIGGLKVRAPVKSAGVLVGRVEEIRYDNERFQAEVVFTVDGRYKFPVDTFANILTSGLLGEQYIGLDPGGEEKSLAPGEVIKKTQSAVVLEKLISQFMFDKAADSGSAPAK
ncbi:MAG: outer membrane lipid asymmetry maintenance protein MlaD, partial [Zoogloea sp.]|nr:outer membrane lipid asymmetry maintenance protein MlaD [Zoogloea sp.]